MVCTLTNPNRKAQLIKRDFKTGRDLIVLDVLGPDSSVQGIHHGEDMEGLYHVVRTVVRKSSSYQEGSTPTPIPRVEERLGYIHLDTVGRSAAEWEQIETLLWSVLDARWDAVWRTFDAHGQWRETRIRIADKVSDQTTLTLGRKPFRRWKIPIVSTDPFWYSTEIPASITRAQMTKTSAAGVTPEVWQGTIPLINPADERCFVEWASGQITATETWTLPDAGAKKADGTFITHTLPSLGPGFEFLVDTYPEKPTLRTRAGGNGPWARMKAEAFEYWLPASMVIPIQVPVKVVGGAPTSQIKAYMKQRWNRPVGGQLVVPA